MKVLVKNFKKIAEKNEKQIINNNFLNNQNYAISENDKVNYYLKYVKKKEKSYSSLSFACFMWLFIFISHFKLYSIVSISLLIFLFLVTLIIVIKELFFWVKDSINDTRLKLWITKFGSKNEMNYHLFRKKIWWNTKSYFYKIRKK